VLSSNPLQSFIAEKPFPMLLVDQFPQQFHGSSRSCCVLPV